MALHGAARQPTVVNSGNRGEHRTLPLPKMADVIDGGEYFTGKIDYIARQTTRLRAAHQNSEAAHPMINS